jgi:DNA-binding MarR family transcriptional regulator/AcrR family transcriptional regulator
MPKRVDHEQRRRLLAEAVWRIAATRGLPAATLREVAAEAGVSMRLVQYYFHTKERMLVYALEHGSRAAGERMRARFAALGRPPAPVDVVRICLLELLPTDEQSLMLARVHAAYYAAALTDPILAAASREGSLGGAAVVNPQDQLTSLLTAQLRAGREAGQVPAAIDPVLEARALAALAAGLSSTVLAGVRSGAEAVDLIGYHVDRLFPPGLVTRKYIPGNYILPAAVDRVVEFFDVLVRYEVGLWDLVDQRLRRPGQIGLGRLHALRVVDRYDGRARVQDLSEAIGITVGAASKLVDRLERDGLALRSRNPAHRRSSLIALTAAGRATLAPAAEVFRAAVAEAVAGEDVEALTDTLSRLQARLDGVITTHFQED